LISPIVRRGRRLQLTKEHQNAGTDHPNRKA
jgi:hypothetical protein